MSAEPTARRPTWDCSGRERDTAYWIAGASLRQQAPLLLLHGFAGTHATWSATADRFGEQRRIIAPDLPGHGQSSCAHEDCTFESAASGRDAKQASNWITGDLFGRLNKAGLPITESPVSAAALGGLLDLIADGTISGRIAKDVFEEMFESGKNAATIVEEKGLRQITDTGALEDIVDAVIARGEAQVAQFQSGNEKILGWFVGQVMKESQGKANPQAVNEILRKKLAG